MKKQLWLSTLFTFMAIATTYAQSESTDFMRSTGKIYVVVAVIVIVFLGIVAFLIRLDRKLTKLESQIKEHGKN
jgi:CcmD family protein